MLTHQRHGDAGSFRADIRRSKIAEMLRGAGHLTIEDVQHEWAVSAMTVRRDFDALQRQGLARRTHGGAVVARPGDLTLPNIVPDSGAGERLARRAAELVSSGELVFVDGSDAGCRLARHLLEREIPLTIVTNGVRAMQYLASHSHDKLRVIGLAGRLERATGSFVGPDVIGHVRDRFVDLAFLTAAGIDDQGILTDRSSSLADVKRAMIAQADRAILLAEETFGHEGTDAIVQVGRLSGGVLATPGLPDSQLRRLQRHSTIVRQPTSR